MRVLKMFGSFISIAIAALLFTWIGFEFAHKPTDFQVKKMFRCKNQRDYQIDLHMDTVWVYDGDRLIGRYTSNWHNQIDTILITDNQ